MSGTLKAGVAAAACPPCDRKKLRALLVKVREYTFTAAASYQSAYRHLYDAVLSLRSRA